MSKELEEAIKECQSLAVCLLSGVDEPDNEKSGKAIETVLQALKNSIHKEVIEKKINYYKGAVNNEDYKKLYNSCIADTEIIIEFLQELLEENK